MPAGAFHCLHGVDKQVVKNRPQKLWVAHYFRHVFVLDDADGDTLFGGLGLDDPERIFDDLSRIYRLEIGLCRPRII